VRRWLFAGRSWALRRTDNRQHPRSLAVGIRHRRVPVQDDVLLQIVQTIEPYASPSCFKKRFKAHHAAANTWESKLFEDFWAHSPSRLAGWQSIPEPPPPCDSDLPLQARRSARSTRKIPFAKRAVREFLAAFVFARDCPLPPACICRWLDLPIPIGPARAISHCDSHFSPQAVAVAVRELVEAL